MERMPGRGTRAVRGAAASAVAVLFAGTAHTLSGGEAPPPWLLVAVAILAAPLCTALVGRGLSLSRLALAVAAAQLALHAAFALVGSAAPAAHIHHHMLALPALGVDAPAAAMTTAMATGHAIAGLVTFAVLAWGERLLAAIARGIRRLLRLVPGCAPAPTVRAARAASTARVLPHVVFVHCATRRGPPTPFASASAA